MALILKAFSANYKLGSATYKVKGALYDGRYPLIPYIGRVTVMVVPSFSLLSRWIVP